MITQEEMRAWRNCDHDWAWEHARMLCIKCGWERPADDTMEYAQARISELEHQQKLQRIYVDHIRARNAELERMLRVERQLRQPPARKAAHHDRRLRPNESAPAPLARPGA